MSRWIARHWATYRAAHGPNAPGLSGHWPAESGGVLDHVACCCRCQCAWARLLGAEAVAS